MKQKENEFRKKESQIKNMRDALEQAVESNIT